MDPDSSDLYRDLKLELKSLQEIITLTGLAIQAYEYTPLGRGLANVVDQAAEGRRVILQELFDTISGYRQGLNPMDIRYFWRQVWWSGYEVDELASLRVKLSACRNSLLQCLKALNS